MTVDHGKTVRFGRSRGAALLLFLGALSSGCAVSDDMTALQGAHHHYRIGNYPDALYSYEKVIPALQRGGYDEVNLARTREASCLIRLGRYDEAVESLEKVSAGDLPVKDRRELNFVRAESAIERGRHEEPSFLRATPRNRPEIERRKKEAAESYRQASVFYKQILDDDPKNYAALRGRGVALMRQGIVSRDSQFLQMATDIFLRCERLRKDDEQVQFFRGLSILHGPGRGSLTRNSARLLVEALLLDRDRNYDFHVGYYDLYLYLRAFATPPDLEKAFRKKPRLVPAAVELVDLLDGYATTGRTDEGAADEEELERIRNYVSTYRRWETDRDDADRKIVLTRKKLKETQIGAVDKYKSAMEFVNAVPGAFRETPEYMQCRTDVQSEYVSTLMEFSRRLIDVDALELPETYVDTVIPLLERPWIPDPSPIRTEANIRSTEIDALKEFDKAAARSRELFRRNQLEEARKVFARYKRSVQGRAELAFVSHRIEEFEKELADPEKVAGIQKAMKEGEIHQISGDTSFGVAALREKAGEYFRAKKYEECLRTLERIGQTTPDDSLMIATCRYETGDYRTACSLLSRSPLDDTSFFRTPHYIMAGNAFLKYGQGTRRASEKISSFRRAREFFESAEEHIAAVRTGKRACYGNLYQVLATQSDQDPLEIEEILEGLVALDPEETRARHELALLLYEKGSRAKSSFRRDTAYRRAYALLAELDRRGELELSATRRKDYHRLVACYGDFLPLATGNRWVYSVSNGRTRSVSVKTPTATGHFDVEIDSGRKKRLEIWQKTPSLFTRFDTDRQTMMARSFPIRLLVPNRLAAWSYPLGDVRYDAEVVTTGETCQTPAGRFTKCIKVRLTNSRTGDESYHYFAPQVGEVKMESENISYELTDVTVASESRGLALNGS